MITRLVECRNPWRWSLVEGLVDVQLSIALRDSIILAPMATKEPMEGRPYDLEFIRVKLFDEATCPGFPWMTEAARKAVGVLAGDVLREAISDILDFDLSEALAEVNYWRWPTGSYVGAHLDRFPRVVTHVLYLNDNWNVESGGALEILETEYQEVPSISIRPGFGRSMLIQASGQSWHRVAEITGHGGPRLTISTAYAIGTSEDLARLGHSRTK